jgi:rhodanese-related sulfurtransferase/DNA-binding transcriptional ArsR family regulator
MNNNLLAESTPTTETRRRQLKEELYEQFYRIANALANPHRLELIDLLVQGPRTVEELAAEAHMSIANTSQHLQRLKQARLVQDERQGLYVSYRLADSAVTHLWLDLRRVAERQLADVERAHNAYRPQRQAVPQISMTALQAHLTNQAAILLDVRPTVEYEAGHLPTAISMPLDELPTRVDELPTDKLIVAYCRGPYCVYADDALLLLATHGRQVARLEEGVAEWQQAGYALHRSYADDPS